MIGDVAGQRAHPRMNVPQDPPAKMPGDGTLTGTSVRALEALSRSVIEL